MKIPQGHQTVMPYMILVSADKFKEFVKNVFNAIERAEYRDANNKIMHAELQIGGSTIMFAESADQWKPQTAGLYLYVADADTTFDIAVKQGATVIMAPEHKDYGRTCGIKDPCGNTWWITSASEN